MTNRTWHKLAGPAVIFSLARLGKRGLLAGTNEGLWHYRDGDFRMFSDALQAAAITAVAASPTYPIDSLILVGSVDGIATSIDDGKTWTSAKLTLPSQVSQIVLSPNFEADSTIFATTLEDGLLRTDDRGEHWANWNFGLLDLETLALAVSLDFAEDETAFIATGTGIFRSVNGGRAWREVAFAGEGPAAEEALPPTGVAMTKDMLVVSTESKGLYYSRDHGDSWFKRSAFRGGQTSVITASYDYNRLILATPTAIAISENSGGVWQRVAKPPDNVISIALDDDGTLLCGTQEDGLWVYR